MAGSSSTRGKKTTCVEVIPIIKTRHPLLLGNELDKGGLSLLEGGLHKVGSQVNSFAISA